MPYFESLFCRPFLVELLFAAASKLDPSYSEQETDFDYVINMMHTVSLFNEYSELQDIVGDYDVDTPVNTPGNTKIACAACRSENGCNRDC